MSEAWSALNPIARPRPGERPIIGRRPIILASSLVIASLFITAFARFTGIGVASLPDTPVVESRELTLVEQPDGRVEVRTAATGEMVQSLALRDGGGFIQAIIKGMMFERAPKKIGPEVPYRLARHADGRLILHDPATGRRQTVDTFGSVNTEAFAVLLSGGGLLSKGEKR
jgi:putative photosynthetic complex assembly protein